MLFLPWPTEGLLSCVWVSRTPPAQSHAPGGFFQRDTLAWTAFRSGIIERVSDQIDIRGVFHSDSKLAAPPIISAGLFFIFSFQRAVPGSSPGFPASAGTAGALIEWPAPGLPSGLYPSITGR